MNEKMMEEPEDGETLEAPVDEGYIEKVSDGASMLIPEDFSSMNLKVPTQAPDGTMVSVVLTGKAMGGVLQNVYGAEIPETEEEKPQGRMKKVLMGGTEEEN